MAAPGQVGRDLIERCQQLMGAELRFPFGPEPPVFTVGAKMFALFAGPEPEIDPTAVSLKCDPEYAAVLVREHDGITPGYHLNKRHWITVDLTSELPPGLALDLLVDSYDLVVSSLPRARRPPGRGRSAT